MEQEVYDLKARLAEAERRVENAVSINSYLKVGHFFITVILSMIQRSSEIMQTLRRIESSQVIIHALLSLIPTEASPCFYCTHDFNC